MSLKQIVQNPTLVENLFGPAADIGAAFINENDWFENDGLLEKIPYGKIVAWIIKKGVEISNVDKAFNHAYALSYFLCFSQAVKRYKVFLKETYLVEIKAKQQTDELFPLGNNFELVGSEIYTHYSSKYNLMLTACNIADKTTDTILNYIQWNLRIVFHELLENKPTTYKKLCEKLDKTSFLLRNEKLRITQYYQEQKNLFLLPVMGDEQGLTLENVYIEPQYRIHKISIEATRIKKDFYESEFENTERRFTNLFVEPKIKSYINIHEILDDFVSGIAIRDNIKWPYTRTFVLLGYPGQGKTSCIRKLLFDLIKDVENPELVYHLPLRAIENVSNFCNAPFEVIEEHIKSKNLPSEYAKDLTHKGTIILEGLDELAIKSGTNEKTIDEIVWELLRVQENRKEVKVIITSRLGYLDCAKFSKMNLLIVQLKEFNEQQQIGWLEKYQKFNPQCKITQNKITQFNVVGHHLKELINQPILLHMVVSSDIEISNNTNRAKLYELLFTSLIERKWANQVPIDILGQLDAGDLREIIQDIALAIFQSGKNCIQKKEIEEQDAVKRHIINTLGFNKLGGALKGVMVAFYFQEVEKEAEKGNHDYGIEFLHKSLSEYMAAEKIWKEIKVFLEYGTNPRRNTIDSPKQAIEKINYLFAPQMLTVEVRNYIWEIMENDADYNRAELSDRFFSFFPDLLRKEFLDAFDAEICDYPIKRALNAFYGYWTVLSKLAEHLKRNYLDAENLKNFINILKLNSLHNTSPISLCHQNLSNANLSGANLSRANLSGAILSKVDLSGANIKEANFTGACLADANLSRANFIAVNFSKANLEGANLEGANLEGANLEGANLEGANLEGANLKGTNFSKVNLESGILSGANLSGTNLSGANLERANLERANLEWSNLERAILDGAILSGANLERAKLFKATLDYATLEGAILEGANFSSAKLLGADLFRANLERANFEGANFEGANLFRVDLSKANLYRANLSGAILEGCFLSWKKYNELKKSGFDLTGVNAVKEGI